jgi:hypothetical protein
MKRLTAFLLIAAFCLVISAGVFASDKNWKLAIRDRGTVENQYSGRGNWHRIWQTRMLNDGDRLRTHTGSRASIKLPDNSLVSIGENSEVEMSEFRMDDRSRSVKVKLFMGKVRSRVGHFFGKESKYEVETPNGVLAARGTDFLVEHSSGDGGGQTTLTVYSSSVDITASGQTMTVSAGNMATFGPTGDIQMNPVDYNMGAPEGTSTVDVDLYEPTSDSSVPTDPVNNTTTTGTVTSPGTTTTGTTTTGGVQPPPPTTGDVIIEIVPTK